MQTIQTQILKNELNFLPDEQVLKDLNKWLLLFKEYNSHTNLISKNDVEQIFEKHIFDSLGILKYKEFNPNKSLKILDFGTGGGFPSVILAICFRNLNIIANDSIGKKIKFIEILKEELKLDNLTPIKERVENLPPQNVDYILSRAVGKTADVYKLTKKHLNNNGRIVLYKGKNVQDELLDFKHKTELVKYTLPTKEHHERYLVII